MKKLFKKTYSQLTGLKKYYPVHIFVLPLILMSVPLYIFIIYDQILHPDDDTIFLSSLFIFMLYELVIYLFLIISIIVGIFMHHISKKLKVKIYIDSRKLLENKFYNFLFISTLIFAVFSQVLLIITAIFDSIVIAVEFICHIFAIPLYLVDLVVHHVKYF